MHGQSALDQALLYHTQTNAFEMPHWAFWGIMVLWPAIFLVLARWRAAADAKLRAKDQVTLTEDVEEDAKKKEWTAPGNILTRAIDKTSYGVGIFVSMWSVICVCYYTFEVISRYFFDAPTDWVHEASFLMFGVMYTLGGAALYLADGHVRVDVFYSKWGPRGQAAADLVTSPIFFIFIAGMLISGWIFWAQGLDRNILPHWLAMGYNMDISQTEWRIAYWPIKFAIPLGAFLVLAQGLSQFIKNFQTFRHYGDEKNG